MANSIVETYGTLRPDGRLDLDQSVGVPPGRVKVRLESMESPQAPDEPLVDFVDRTRRELAAAGHRFRTAEENDAELDELRGEWDDRGRGRFLVS